MQRIVLYLPGISLYAGIEERSDGGNDIRCGFIVRKSMDHLVWKSIYTTEILGIWCEIFKHKRFKEL